MNAQYIQTLLDESIHAVEVVFLQDTSGQSAQRKVPPRRDIGKEFIDYLTEEEIVAKQLATRNYSGKSYTYLTHEDHRPGSHVVVEANNEWKVALVVKHHSVPPITEDDKIEYKWVVQSVDTEGYSKRMLVVAEVLKKIAEVGREHRRNMARQAILASYPQLAPPAREVYETPPSASPVYRPSAAEARGEGSDFDSF